MNQREVLKNVTCPICLGELRESDESHELSCVQCSSRFAVRDDVPIMLVADANWQKKQDEIKGEILYNTKVVPQSTHLQRNTFLNDASRRLLRNAGVDLTGRSVLVIGCSMAEAECFQPLSGSLVGLDIVPDFTLLYKNAARQANMTMGWVCGDGECLPFPTESFDVVIVRQSLHHMLRYYSAISEFFRVCRIGGVVAVIDEPYTEPDFAHPAIARLPDHFLVDHAVSLGEVRKAAGWNGKVSAFAIAPQFADYERPQDCIPALSDNAAELLADKYHRFSAVELIVALRMHTDDVTLFWPETIGWTDHSGLDVLFCSGRNPALGLSIANRLARATTFSAIAVKHAPTRYLRSRVDLVSVVG